MPRNNVDLRLIDWTFRQFDEKARGRILELLQTRSRSPHIAGVIVFSEIELLTTDVDRKTAMRRRAISTREVLNRHRWAVGLMESRMTPGPASLRLHNAVLGCLREAGFSIKMTIEAYSVQDAYIYGFALQEESLPFESAEEAAAVAEEQVREFAELPGGTAARRARRGISLPRRSRRRTRRQSRLRLRSGVRVRPRPHPRRA